MEKRLPHAAFAIRLGPRLGMIGLISFVLLSVVALSIRVHVEHLSILRILEQSKMELEHADLSEHQDRLERLCNHLHEKGYDLLLQQPSGIWLPDERLGALARPFFLEAPTLGALNGGKIRVAYSSSLPQFVVVLILSGIIVLLATMKAQKIATEFAQQSELAAATLESIAQDRRTSVVDANSGYREIINLIRQAEQILDAALHQSLTSFVKTESLHDLERVRAELLSSVSHDLRAPLSATIGLLELLIEDSSFTVEQRNHLIILERRSYQLLKRLNEVLDSAKLEKSVLQLFTEEALVSDLVRRAIQQAERGRDPDAVPAVELELEPGLLPMKVDALRITQALGYALDTLFDEAALFSREHFSDRITLRVRRSRYPGDAKNQRWLVVEMAGYVVDRASAVSQSTPVDPSHEWNLSLVLARKLVAALNGYFEEEWEPGSAWAPNSQYRKIRLWLASGV